MVDRTPKKPLRCAIYTRKSSEEGLEQDFNSLQAQREACEAFIASQKHEGWKLVPTLYDDGGYSGGTMERPGLKKLLADIQSRLVDVVVVYKVDRLTRSLADFAKIVEVFDAQGVSFVSVTQQFNTTTSMGRLTLNVLLSFAQFEREVTGERIRDKIAASKRKGMWMGGWVPLGYDRKDRTLQINKAEAETVRTIFRLYGDLGNVRLVQAELERRKLKTKRYVTSTGRQIGGLPFRRGHIYWILSNPLYVGEIGHKGARHAGQHPPIIKRSEWDAVQKTLVGKRHQHRVRAETTSLLAGILFDDKGNRLSPHNTRKQGKLYRYYVDRPLLGRSAKTAGRPRVHLAATEIERLVVSQLVAFLSDQKRLLECLQLREARPDHIKALLAHAKRLASVLASGPATEVRANVVQLMHRVVVGKVEMRLELKCEGLFGEITGDVGGKNGTGEKNLVTIAIAASSTRSSSGPGLVLHDAADAPARAADPALLKAIARAHVWFEQITRGHVQSLSDIAKREGVTDRYIGQTLSLALIPPTEVESILDGRQRPGITVRSLMTADH